MGVTGAKLAVAKLCDGPKPDLPWRGDVLRRRPAICAAAPRFALKSETLNVTVQAYLFALAPIPVGSIEPGRRKAASLPSTCPHLCVARWDGHQGWSLSTRYVQR